MFSIAMLPQAGCEQSDIEHCSRLLVVRSLIVGSVGSDRFATRISAHGWSHVRVRSGVIRVAQDSRCYNLVRVVAAVGGKQKFHRGVAQPGRAPGSGPGGRRFKSSLPDQFFQSLTRDFWSSVYSGVGNFEAAKASEINTIAIFLKSR